MEVFFQESIPANLFLTKLILQIPKDSNILMLLIHCDLNELICPQHTDCENTTEKPATYHRSAMLRDQD